MDPSFSVLTPSPTIAYVGQPLVVRVGPQHPDYEYRVLTLTPGGDWNFDAPWSASSTLTTTSTTPGIGGLHVQVRHKATGALALDQWVGSYHVFKADQVDSLLTMDRLKISEIESDVSQEASGSAWRAGIDSFDELHAYVESRFLASDAGDGFASQSVSRALFYMQWVSGLWAYGNKLRPDLPGGVTQNEVVGTIPPDEVSATTFLQSPIGMCTDYASVLAFLLSEAGIPNRIVTVPGHVFNEAFIDGEWWSLDANTGLAYAAPWDKVIDTSATVEVMHFDHESMREGSPIYRELAVEFYHWLVPQVANGAFQDSYRYDTATWLAALPYGDILLDEMNLAGSSASGPFGPILSDPDYGSFSVDQFNALTSASLQRLQISEIDDQVSHEASGTAWRAGIDSFDELHAYVDARFAASGSADASSAVSRALFYLQWVSGLWTYQGGSGASSGRNGAPSYLQASSGTATDSAAVLGFLLENAGIPNRVVTVAGRVLNEAELDGEWWTLDATLGLAFAAPWDVVVETGTTPKVLDFDHEGMRQGSPIYSEALVRLYHETLVSTANGLLYDLDRHETAEWFASLVGGWAFLNELWTAIAGDDAGNTLVGGPAGDAIAGLGGADVLIGLGGNDSLEGGAGNDALDGGAGRDSLYGGDGIDSLYGGADADMMSGGAETDYVYGNAGHDLIQGGDAFDGIEGGDGDDAVWGEGGNDAVYGGLGNDALNGGAETDYLYGQDGDDVLIGGAAYDAFEGGAGNDTIAGETGDDVIYGGPGDDVISGGEGHDYLYGEAGSDTFYHVSGQSEGDAVYGFEAGDGAGDVIRLIGTGMVSFADVLSVAYETGGYTVIPTGAASALYLFNIAIAQLAADDFLFA